LWAAPPQTPTPTPTPTPLFNIIYFSKKTFYDY
jgi:hypothetical protein